MVIKLMSIFDNMSTPTLRYKSNPFLVDMVLDLKERQVRLSPLGRDNNILVDQSTGEIRGTHVVTYKRIDGEQFVKLFTKNIALTFDLSGAGIKTFSVLCWAIQSSGLSKDYVVLDAITHTNFMGAHADWEPPLKLSLATFRRGLAELERAKLIAKAERAGHYWINPNFVFNGDRVAFTTVLERRHLIP